MVVKGFWRWSVVITSLLVVMVLGACSPGQQGLKVGDEAPDFSLPTANGGVFSLGDYTGQPVLLYFHMAVG